MKLRTVSRLSVVTLAAVVGAILYIARGPIASTRGANLTGTDLAVGGTYPSAPGFRLTDQLGQEVSLQQFAGHPVVLAFLYTHCPDACQQEPGRIRTALDRAGKAAGGAGVLAVSLDPQGDTPAAALAFSDQQQMTSRWRYLIGTCSQLSAVWKAYGVGITGCNGGSASVTSAGTGHPLGLYLIDKRGRERVYLDSDFTPQALAGDLQALAAE
jgi:protein SCO1